MAWKMRVIEGPLTGQEFPVQPGLTLGRAKAGINLEDPKVSGKHAEFVQTPSGALVLTDLESTNGLKFKGRRVQEVICGEGVQVRLGQTVIEIIAAEIEKNLTFGQKVSSFLSSLPLANRASGVELTPFPNVIRLEFVKGLQVETVWYVGYGPRHFGPGSGEFPIIEEGIGELCFSIFAESNKIFLVPIDSSDVTVNGQKFKKHPLEDGDLIGLGSALIHVKHVSE